MDARHSPSEGKVPAGSSVSDRLDSWKAIATFLRRDVRTVQRWEATEGLPVYRHQHSKLGSVYAHKSEIDSWWKARQASVRRHRSKRRQPRAFLRAFTALPYPKIAIYALLILAVVLSVAKAKQMFLNTPKAPQPVALSKPASIVVLPFQSVSVNSDDTALASNITQEIIGDFRRLTGLRLVGQNIAASSRNANNNPQQISPLSHADKLLRGTAGRSGNSIRITAQLVDPATGTTIWSKTFQQSAADLLQAERDIANAIASDVKSTLGVSPPPA